MQWLHLALQKTLPDDLKQQLDNVYPNFKL